MRALVVLSAGIYDSGDEGQAAEHGGSDLDSLVGTHFLTTETADAGGVVKERWRGLILIGKLNCLRWHGTGFDAHAAESTEVRIDFRTRLQQILHEGEMGE